MTNTLSIYVLVAGAASDPQDADLPGVYRHTVALPIPQDQRSQDVQDAVLCTAVLDEFHNRQGVEVLDDFTIRVVMADGREIHECDELPADLQQERLAVDHDGKVSEADVPAAVLAAARGAD